MGAARYDAIIVGGAKVFPKRGEEVIREVPGVTEVRVYGVPSSVTGELVAAEITLAPGAADGDGADAKTAVLAHCREVLEPHSVPRVLEIVERIATTAAGKTPRRG